MEISIDWSHFADNWGMTVLFCVGLYFLTLGLRKSVEWKWPSVTGKGTFWEEVLLPVLPVLLGVLVALAAKSYPYPSLIKVWVARVFYGGVCGGCSAYVYMLTKVVVKAVLAKYGVTVPSSSTPPSPPNPLP